MLDIAFIRQNADVVRAAIKNKRVELDLDVLLAADKDRRELLGKIEQKRARKNEIAQLIPKATKEERPTLIEGGLIMVIPPVMVKERAMTGTGFFPLGREEAYAITADELFLVGTSEVPLVSLHCDDTLDAATLPIRYAGISNCFRREAGAYGKDTKGLYR